MGIIDVENLRKHFPVKRGAFKGKEWLKAVDGVSFSIQEGGVFALVGESGSGKSTVAQGLAKHFQFHYYDVDEVKKLVCSENPEYARCMAEGVPLPDEARLEVFERVVRDLEELARREENIVVDETLHRRVMRHVLYDAARRISGDFIVVWVRADKSVIVDRLRAKKREGHILDDPLPMHEAIARDFEEFNRSVIVCSNNSTPENAVADLVSILEKIAGVVKAHSERQASSL